LANLNDSEKEVKENGTIEEKTEILRGEQQVIGTELQFFFNSKERVDTYMNYTRPQLAILLKPIKKAFLDAKTRGVELRYVTEITNDNISACKELMTIVDELRHLDGIKGNFMVSESEYLAPIVLFEKGKVASQIIYSNLKEIAEHQQYTFDSFWSKAIPAQEKIREIEEGVATIRTSLLENQDEIIKEIKRLNNSANKLSICSVFGGMEMSYDYFFDSYKRIVDIYLKGKGDGVRCILNIDKDSIKLVKLFLESGIQVRHIKEMLPMNFGVSDKEVALTIEKMEGGKMSQSFVISNHPSYVNHFNSFFEQLWKGGVDAAGKIKAIEQGVEPEFLEVITDHQIASQIFADLAKSVKKEALFLLPTDKAMLRVERLGVIDYLIHASLDGAKVKIICPLSSENADVVKRIHSNAAEGIKILNGSNSLYGIFIVDGEKFFRAELREPDAIEFSDAIGFTIYSNSRRSAESFKSVFELLWNERTLNEELKRAHRMQREFIDIAAHELRTPIQPILALTETLYSHTNDPEQAKSLEVIRRNAKRLMRLSNDILDVTRIEGKSLELKEEEFNLKDVILDAMNDITLRREFLDKKNIGLSYNPQDISIQADKERITQVVYNLLDNAVKFINKAEKGGTVTIEIEKKTMTRGRIERQNKEHDNIVVVNIKDDGPGIDPEVMPKLFSKFVSTSFTGTGLGLFISKSIVEAHGGDMWAGNNADGKGATFTFSLPIREQNP
jgi:signal transduction histidine kinase